MPYNGTAPADADAESGHASGPSESEAATLQSAAAHQRPGQDVRLPTSVGGQEPGRVRQRTTEDVQGVAWCQAEAIEAEPDGTIPGLYQPLAVSVWPAGRSQDLLLPPKEIMRKVAHRLILRFSHAGMRVCKRFFSSIWKKMNDKPALPEKPSIRPDAALPSENKETARQPLPTQHWLL